MNQTDQRVLPRSQFQSFLDVVAAQRYEIIGPTIDQDAIVYRPITNVSQLPCGWSDRQEPGKYRLVRGEHRRYFRFNASPDSWKKYLFPARSEISRATLDQDGWHFTVPDVPAPRQAFLGIHACDLAAISIQDRVFMNDDYVDPTYRKRREAALLIAVNCSTAVSTCFCTSMNGAGPECSTGFDLCLTELEDSFVIAVGSSKGTSIVESLPTRAATEEDRLQVQHEIRQAESAIAKRFDTDNLHDLLLENLEHAHWSEVAERCLACANCTMVCPTCFCNTVEEVSDLGSNETTRVRQWDSCFNLDLSYTADGTVRDSARSQYRQWLTHKLATWEDQFDVSGCTGCGRCITWCPVGIDLTAEVATIRHDSEAATLSSRSPADQSVRDEP